MTILSEHGETSFTQVLKVCSESLNWIAMEETDFLECYESIKFAKEMASASLFSSLQSTLDTLSIESKPGFEFQMAYREQFKIIKRHIARFFQKREYIRSTTKSPIIQTAVKDFDLNKKPYFIEDLDPVAREKARHLCEILHP
ncbi:hypothetical protein PIB30_036117 [Stylosanthes scabra]|uniref:Uncharacterized protein n=1 Tax=Stylosanthes scabra TaxID=79078 RepID=A0ABU6VD00_9FABA|nr:hypothetical protein [Stylosanthes scabra]